MNAPDHFATVRVEGPRVELVHNIFTRSSGVFGNLDDSSKSQFLYHQSRSRCHEERLLRLRLDPEAFQCEFDKSLRLQQWEHLVQ